MIDKSQEKVEGKVRLKLFKGNTMITGRESSLSLYNPNLATFESDNIYSQKLLNWVPSRNLEDMCRDGWNWQKRNPEGYH